MIGVRNIAHQINAKLQEMPPEKIEELKAQGYSGIEKVVDIAKKSRKEKADAQK